MPISDEKMKQLEQEAADWDSGKLKPTDPGWVDAPQAIPSVASKYAARPALNASGEHKALGKVPKVSVPGSLSVRRLLDTDPCPCKSGKQFGECEPRPTIEGLTPENTLHLLFEERDPSDTSGTAPVFYAVQTLKMNGEVPAETIVENIAKRLHSPPIGRVLERLTWKTLDSNTTVVDLVPEPQAPAVIAPSKELLGADGKPVKL